MVGKPEKLVSKVKFGVPKLQRWFISLLRLEKAVSYKTLNTKLLEMVYFHKSNWNIMVLIFERVAEKLLVLL